MKRRIMFILFVLALLVSLAAFSRPAAQVSASRAFSAVPLRRQVAAEFRVQGKPSPELRLPKSVNNGRPFNPSEAYPNGTIETPEELKALVILVEFSDTVHTYDQDIFEDLVLGEFMF